MSDETFAAALRAEIDAVVGRYEALVRALGALGDREVLGLRAEVASLAAENQRLRAEAAERKAAADAQKAEIASLTARVASLTAALDEALARADRLAGEAHAALEATLSYEEQFASEKRFVDAARDIAASLLGEALAAALGRPVEATSASYAALKSRGLEATLVAAVRERGRTAASAPLLPRERAGLQSLAAAAGCELVTPAAGTRFTAGSMEKAGAVSEPAEEGNVLECAMPGLRRAGTEGALVFPRVVVATG